MRMWLIASQRCDAVSGVSFAKPRMPPTPIEIRQHISPSLTLCILSADRLPGGFVRVSRHYPFRLWFPEDEHEAVGRAASLSGHTG